MSEILSFLLIAVALAILGVFGYAAYYASRTIHDLLAKNEILQKAIGNLTHESQIGYAKVLSQEERDGVLRTRVLFVETDREDMTKRILEKEYEVEGDVLHFDALIVKFGKEAVMDGRERALYLWRRVYGERMSPDSGHPIESEGTEPARYARLFEKLPLKSKDVFWRELWQLADDPDRLSSAGVRAIYGNVVYKKLRPGLIYAFKIDNQGGLYPETFPAL